MPSARALPASAQASSWVRASTRVRFAGALAREALQRSAGVTCAVAGFEATPFRYAAGDIIWVGLDGPLHPRTVLIESDSIDAPLDVKAATLFRPVHRPETVGGSGFITGSGLQAATGAILRLMHLSKPAGFGMLLMGRVPPFPLSHRVDAARALARACVSIDVDAFCQAAERLLGAGAGLTPSGDDFVGGALFALRMTHAASRWQPVSQQIVRRAGQRTHVISAALLSDLARGHSYAALHDFASALARSDSDGAFRHAMALVSIGSSSGWDMLAGFIAALAGTLDIS